MIATVAVGVHEANLGSERPTGIRPGYRTESVETRMERGGSADARCTPNGEAASMDSRPRRLAMALASAPVCA
ncbi:MAG: hypothetical protein QOE38_2277 [Thermoleophilaceae bacterium]|jgi:hypothetical protein|nr:hypothetical protein [Thermoleophilaceae bacterium]